MTAQFRARVPQSWWLPIGVVAASLLIAGVGFCLFDADHGDRADHGMPTVRGLVGAVAVVLALGVGAAWAEAKITVTREESKPQKVEVEAGEDMKWVNASGGTAHVWFAGHDGIRFYIGKEGRVKFDKPGTYDYTVHISGTKVHEHTGTVVVK